VAFSDVFVIYSVFILLFVFVALVGLLQEIGRSFQKKQKKVVPEIKKGCSRNKKNMNSIIVTEISVVLDLLIQI